MRSWGKTKEIILNGRASNISRNCFDKRETDFLKITARYVDFEVFLLIFEIEFRIEIEIGQLPLSK